MFFLKKYQEGTATYLPFLPTGSDCNVFSPYCLTAINNYRVEYDAEICRKAYYPKYPSRLSAVYAFGDYETCEKVVKIHPDWRDLSTLKKFRLIETPLTRVIKVNMEIVTLAQKAYRISSISQSDLDNLWKHYWNGGGNFQMELPDVNFSRTKHDSGEIFEYLIEGAVVLNE